MKNKTYEKLYLRILEIGQQNLVSGTSLNKLKKTLREDGYAVKENDCIELAIEYWFFTSFHHVKPDGRPLDTIEQIKGHSDCNFILKGEASLLLLEHSKIDKTIKLNILAIATAVIIALASTAISYSISIRSAANADVPVQQTPSIPMPTFRPQNSR